MHCYSSERHIVQAEKINILNPKQDKKKLRGRDNWFPYYAGFSTEFANSLIKSTCLGAENTLLDPWNGSGTTTTAAMNLGINSIGIDLNPVMVIASKARSLCIRQKNSLFPLALDIIKKSHETCSDPLINDPLTIWFTPKSASSIRDIEFSLQRLLLGKNTFAYLNTSEDINNISDLAAFFYTALFKLVRSFLIKFVPSNPTWTKCPKNLTNRVRPKKQAIQFTYLQIVSTMIEALKEDNIIEIKPNTSINITLASSESLPIPNDFIDFILTSPPYCTRIDYAIATMPELALLGYDRNGKLDSFRRKMIGSSTVPKKVADIKDNWGAECINFLNKVKNHDSKASNTYYYKSHVQYFSGIYSSLAEICRVLKKQSVCVLVIQDSYYKEIHNDLAKIINEMFQDLGMIQIKRRDFTTGRVMSGKHLYTKMYRNSFLATESVLCFFKN